MRHTEVRWSIFTRSVVLFLCTVLPLFVTGIVAFRYQEQSLVDAYEDRVEKEVTDFFGQIEDDLLGINNQQIALVSDNSFLRLQNKDSFDYNASDAINSLGTKLILMNENGLIDECTIYLGSKQHSISVHSQRMNYLLPDTTTIQALLEHQNYEIMRWYDDDLYIVTYPISRQVPINELRYLIYTKVSLDDIFERIATFGDAEAAIASLRFENNDITLADPMPDGLFDEETSYDCIGAYINYDGNQYYVISYHSSFLNAVFKQAIPVSVLYGNTQQFQKWYWAFCILMSSAVVLYSVLMHRTIKKPMDMLLDGFRELENEHFDTRLSQRQVDEFSVCFSSFNHMAGKLDNLINDVYAQKILIQRAELRQLQAQINPHFLFNSFYTLRNRISEGRQADAECFCSMLASYFAFITKNDQEFVTLEDEVDHARNFAQIQAIRFQGRIELHFAEIPQDLARLRLPKLIIQPVLENAFKYGLEEADEDLRIDVCFDVKQPILQIVVENSGDDLDEETIVARINSILSSDDPMREPSALYNINRRIQILCGANCGIFVEKSKQLGGLKVVIRMNIEELQQTPKFRKQFLEGKNQS